MKKLVSGALWLALVALPAPVFPNHDQGQGKSQDYPHRGPGSEGVVPVSQVTAPSAATLLALGLTLLVGAAIPKRRRTHAKPEGDIGAS